MPTQLPADLADALYALKSGDRDNPIPDRPFRDDLIVRLLDRGILPSQANKLIDLLIDQGILRNPGEGASSQFRIRGNQITLNLEFDRTAWLMNSDGRKPRLTVAEANNMAMKKAHELGKAFFAMAQRRQAQLIGCSFATWRKTPFFAEAETKRPPSTRRKSASPKVESLTADREAVTGEGGKDEVLQNLIAEQEADNEPSPLESRPRRIHSRKRL
jgi:hypothetical protein